MQVQQHEDEKATLTQESATLRAQVMDAKYTISDLEQECVRRSRGHVHVLTSCGRAVVLVVSVELIDVYVYCKASPPPPPPSNLSALCMRGP